MIHDINNKRNRKGTEMLDIVTTTAAEAATKSGDMIAAKHNNISDVSLFEKWGNIRRVPIEAQDFSGWTGKATAPKVPTRVIYSHKDGIVGTSVARLPAAELTEHLAVESSHIAFAVNPQALGAVAQSLARVA